MPFLAWAHSLGAGVTFTIAQITFLDVARFLDVILDCPLGVECGFEAAERLPRVRIIHPDFITKNSFPLTSAWAAASRPRVEDEHNAT